MEVNAAVSLRIAVADALEYYTVAVAAKYTLLASVFDVAVFYELHVELTKKMNGS